MKYGGISPSAVPHPQRKHARYGDQVMPISLETYGRVGPRSLAALDAAAHEATVYGRTDASPAQLVQRWRADMELALAYATADAVLASRGALQHVAGSAHFPVGRMVPPARAAGGEHSQP